jgi:hypothetical protein
MNHDYAHCANYSRDVCPKECFRGKLVRDLVSQPDYIRVTWSDFKGSDECLLSLNPRKVTLEEILSAEDCSLTGDTKDDKYQIYFFKTGKTYNEGYFGIIEKSIVLDYLKKKDEENEKREGI